MNRFVIADPKLCIGCYTAYADSSIIQPSARLFRPAPLQAAPSEYGRTRQEGAA